MIPAQTKLKHAGAKQLFVIDRRAHKFIFIICAGLCASPLVNGPIALLAGLVIAQTIGHPYLHLNHKLTQRLLQIAVVGLGFSMNFHNALKAGKQGFGLTVASITSILILGYLLGRWLGINRRISHLIASGTAICGGSAIAAIAPVIKASEQQISVAMGCVFILNSIALFLFPVIGHCLHLTAQQFGLWCAIAIHDTSSVVGAAYRYGPTALSIATTVKLARALWIVPVSLLSALLFRNKTTKLKIPYFIALFIAAMALNTWLPDIIPAQHFIANASKACLSLTLFFIGCGLSFNTIANVGLKPVLLSIALWLFICITSLIAILHIS